MELFIARDFFHDIFISENLPRTADEASYFSDCFTALAVSFSFYSVLNHISSLPKQSSKLFPWLLSLTPDLISYTPQPVHQTVEYTEVYRQNLSTTRVGSNSINIVWVGQSRRVQYRTIL